jgi:hypothetical protein
MRHFAFLAALASAPALAQSFTNGNFETADLSGWSVVNTANGVGAPGSATMYDIDGSGPLGSSYAATFQVGQASFSVGDQEGVELTQMLTLTAGTTYTVDLDWSAFRATPTQNAEGGIFSVIVNGTIQGQAEVGNIAGPFPNPANGHLTAHFTAAASGPAAVGIRITRPYLSPGDLSQYVDNVVLTGGAAPCYANCDGSTTPPILNILDFTCFLNQFAAGSTYANCDLSTTPPVLNILDFTCFLNKFAAGCS